MFFATQAFLKNIYFALESEIMYYFFGESFFLLACYTRFQVLPKVDDFLDEENQEVHEHKTRSLTRVAQDVPEGKPNFIERSKNVENKNKNVHANVRVWARMRGISASLSFHL